MRIASVLQFSAYWGNQLPPNVLDAEDGPTCGGGEEAALRTAAELKKLGHDVELFWYGRSGEWNDVPFRGPFEPLYPRLVGEHWDAVISWSGILPLEWAPKSGCVRILAQQLNDLGCQGDWRCVDGIVSPSADHAKQLPLWGWSGKRAVVHNGFVPEDYASSTPWRERPMTVGYWSSPDRGLHHLLRAWSMVTKEIPEARLHVFYEINRFLNSLLAMPVGFYGECGLNLARLLIRAKNDPTIVFVGQQTRRQLGRFQKQCRVQMYPYSVFGGYCEGFATSVCQGLASGCTVVSTPKDALPSLYGDAVHWMTKDEVDRDYPEFVADMTIRALRGELPEQQWKRSLGLQTASKYAWSEAGKQMERVCLGEWEVGL